MAIGKRIDEATTTTERGIVTALKQINEQLDEAERDKRRVVELIGACPVVIEQLGRLGGGQLPIDDGEEIVARALVTDMANGVNDVIQFGSSGNAEVHQKISLEGGASWSALQSFVGEGLEHFA